MEKLDRSILSSCKVRRIDSSKPLPNLPLEIIEQIAWYLAASGSRSAVTARLIHPDIFKLETPSSSPNDLIIGISEEMELNALSEALTTQQKGLDVQLPLRLTLRVHIKRCRSDSDEDRSLTTFIENALYHILSDYISVEVSDFSWIPDLSYVDNITVEDPRGISPSDWSNTIYLDDVTVINPLDYDFKALQDLRVPKLFIIYDKLDQCQKQFRSRSSMMKYTMVPWLSWKFLPEPDYNSIKYVDWEVVCSFANSFLSQISVQEVHFIIVDGRTIKGRNQDAQIYSIPDGVQKAPSDHKKTRRHLYIEPLWHTDRFQYANRAKEMIHQLVVEEKKRAEELDAIDSIMT